MTGVEGKKLTLDFGTLEKVETDPVTLDSTAGLPAYAAFRRLERRRGGAWRAPP